MKARYVFYSLFILMLSYGCVGYKKIPVPQEKCIEKCKVPERFRSPPEGYFVGVSKLYAEEQDAINDAMIHARKQIVDQLGVKIDKKLLEELITKGKTSEVLATDVSEVTLTKIVANNILVGTRMDEYLPQKWTWTRGYELKYYYKVYVLVQFSESENKRFMITLFKQALKNSKDRYEQAQREERKY